jgi:hypothetical protein
LGVFQLASNATLEIAAALGTHPSITFLIDSKLIVDNPGSFGIRVGTSTYAGPTLQDFAISDSIDLPQFASTNVALNFNSSTGVLQISNGASQLASLKFQVSSLGIGTFHATSDGSSGTFITHG